MSITLNKDKAVLPSVASLQYALVEGEWYEFPSQEGQGWVVKK